MRLPPASETQPLAHAAERLNGFPVMTHLPDGHEPIAVQGRDDTTEVLVIMNRAGA
jgi:hypothetical protein